MILKAVAGPGQEGLRLDEGLSALFPRFSKSRIRKVIDWGGVRIFGAVVRVASRPVRAGDAIVFAVTDPDPDVGWIPSAADVVGEDPSHLALNKPAGVYSQRTPYQLKGTAEFGAGRLFRERGIAEPVRVIHRLDRETSGVMVFPKTRAAAARLASLFASGGVSKTYWALVAGTPLRRRFTVDAPIAAAGRSRFAVDPGGRRAVTDFRLLATGPGVSLVAASPRTGRTHQIRLHLVHSGTPVLGDARYGGSAAPRMMLHARSVAFRDAGGRSLFWEAPLDEAFRAALERHGIAAEEPLPPP